MELDKSLKYYLAGPMTGYPEYNYPAFECAAAELRKHFELTVLSPHEIDYSDKEPNGRGSADYQVYIDGGLQLLAQCQAIILLRGWAHSTGALTELRLAKEMQMRVYYYHEGFGCLVDMNRKEVKSSV